MNSLKFYVAAKFERREEVREIYKLLYKKGYKLSADWTLHKPIKPYKEHKETATEFAEEDINGAITCDVFVYLADSEVSSGAFTELGAAITHKILKGKPEVYIIGETTSLMQYHPEVKVRKNINEVLAEI